MTIMQTIKAAAVGAGRGAMASATWPNIRRAAIKGAQDGIMVMALGAAFGGAVSAVKGLKEDSSNED